MLSRRLIQLARPALGKRSIHTTRVSKKGLDPYKVQQKGDAAAAFDNYAMGDFLGPLKPFYKSGVILAECLLWWSIPAVGILILNGGSAD